MYLDPTHLPVFSHLPSSPAIALQVKGKVYSDGSSVFSISLTEKWITKYQENHSLSLCDGPVRADWIMRTMRVL